MSKQLIESSPTGKQWRTRLAAWWMAWPDINQCWHRFVIRHIRRAANGPLCKPHWQALGAHQANLCPGSPTRTREAKCIPYRLPHFNIAQCCTLSPIKSNKRNYNFGSNGALGPVWMAIKLAMATSPISRTKKQLVHIHHRYSWNLLLASLLPLSRTIGSANWLCRLSRESQDLC